MAVSTINETQVIKPTFNTSLFKGYGGASYQEPQLFVRNGIATLIGMVSPIAQLTAADGQLICTIPEGFRPRREMHSIQQGSGVNRWDCVLTVDGKVSLQRYSNSTSAQTVPAGAYLPFNITYVI